MPSKEQDRFIAQFKRKAIKNHNIEYLQGKKEQVLRERATKNEIDEVPVLCTGCDGFFKNSYKSTHQKICPGNTSQNLMLPLVSIEAAQTFEIFSDEFKAVLNSLRLDVIGDYVKTDDIILMIGNRSFLSIKKKQDKQMETTKYVRARMRLTARIYLAFRSIYSQQSAIKLENEEGNSADIFRRETITILGEAINDICKKEDLSSEVASITNQKSSLKISILNLLKLNTKFLLGHFLMTNKDDKAKRVEMFLQVNMFINYKNIELNIVNIREVLLNWVKKMFI